MLKVDYKDINNFKEELKFIEKDIGKYLKQQTSLIGEDLVSRTKRRQFGQLGPASCKAVDTGTMGNMWQLTEVYKYGNEYLITMYNSTYYALWVEESHEVVVHGIHTGSFTRPRHMMKISRAEIDLEMPKRMKEIVENYIKENSIYFK